MTGVVVIVIQDAIKRMRAWQHVKHQCINLQLTDRDVRREDHLSVGAKSILLSASVLSQQQLASFLVGAVGTLVVLFLLQGSPTQTFGVLEDLQEAQPTHKTGYPSSRLAQPTHWLSAWQHWRAALCNRQVSASPHCAGPHSRRLRSQSLLRLWLVSQSFATTSLYVS
jgi:hypothetical protein